MASHLASIWKWDFLELGNGLLKSNGTNQSNHGVPRNFIAQFISMYRFPVRSINLKLQKN